MPKKGRPIIGGWRKGSAPKPPETMDDILTRAEELAAQEKPDEALDLLEEHLPRYSRRAPYRVILALLCLQVDDAEGAAEHASAALDLAPGEHEVQLLASIALLNAGYPALAHRARRSWLSAGLRDHPNYGMEATLDAEYLRNVDALRAKYNLRSAKPAEEAMVAMDEGQWALLRDRPADALRHLRRASTLIPGWPAPHNNIAEALVHIGRPAEAQQETEKVLREMDPDNVHARYAHIRYALMMGETDKVQASGDRLAALPLPEMTEEAMLMAAGLGLLDRDADVERICAQVRKRDGELFPEMEVYWGIAAANLGQRRKALQRVRGAIEAGEDSPLAVETLSALERKKPGRGSNDRYTYSHYTEWAPPALFEAMIALIEREASLDRRDDKGWNAFLENYPQAPLVAEKIMLESELLVGDADQAVTGALRTLARMHTPRALAMVRKFAFGQIGEPEHRWYAVQILQEAGALADGETVTLWADGKPREVTMIAQHVVDSVEPGYPKAAIQALDAGSEHYRAGDMEAAERSFRRALELAPDAVEAFYNLSLIYNVCGQHSQADALRDQALAIDPLYVPALTARAFRFIAGDRLEQARETLRPLLEVRDFDPFSFVTFQRAMALIAMEEGDYAQARGRLLLARDVTPDDPIIADMLSSFTLLGVVGGADNIFRRMDDDSRRRRQKTPISPDPTLAECIERLTGGDMTGIARTIRLSLPAKQRVKERREYFVQAYSDPDLVALIIEGLREAERAALRGLLDHGGVMDWQAFSDAHGNDLTERPYLEYWADKYETVMGRLRARGLLFEGTAEGRLIVAMPRELRPVVAAALNEG
jgi:tetratricopeptide (TPR) repeat protein